MPNGDVLRQQPGSAQVDLERATPVVSRQIKLLDAPGAADVGWWTPWAPLHTASVELSGTFSATCQVLLSNAASMPSNGYTITVTGSETTGDTITVNILGPQFQNGALTTVYKVQSGDTTNNLLAASLAAAIQAAIKAADSIANEQSLGSPAMLAGAIKVSVSTNVVTIATQQPMPWFNVTTSLSGGATESLAVAQYDDGSGQTVTGLSALSSAGLTQFNAVGSWIKGKVSAYTSGNPTLIVTAVSP